MGKSKKEYTNVLAKIIETNNVKLVPLVKSMSGCRHIKFSSRRTIGSRNFLENTGVINIYSIPEDEIKKYLISNHFILELLDSKEVESSMELLNSRDKDNKLIGAACIYELIENKKKELMELNNKQNG